VYTSIPKCNLPQLCIVVVVFETISSKNKLNSQIISSNHQPLPWSRDQTEEGGRKEEEWWGYWLIHQAHIKKKLCAVMTEMKSWRLTVPLRTVLTGAGNQELSELVNQNNRSKAWSKTSHFFVSKDALNWSQKTFINATQFPFIINAIISGRKK